MKKIFLPVFLFFLFSCSSSKEKTSSTTIGEMEFSKPNIIYILADDLGYGDLSCFGQTKFNTPNIDKLAAQGMIFTQHYSGSAVCAPARSSLLTGQHTGHTPIRGNREIKGKEGQTPLPASSFTIAELMKKQDYQTGAFGKWGLGFVGSEGDPNLQGFDEFYGYNCQRMSHRYYPTHIWHNDKKIILKGNDWKNKTIYAPDEIQKMTLNFIEKNKSNPFFAYVALLQPHAELLVPDDKILAQFKGKFEEVPFEKPHGYLSDYGDENFEYQKYCPQETPYATYAAMATRIDNYVGEIMEKVEELGIAENTIIIFTSDNGPATEGGANPTFFNSTGGLKGVKRDLYEGGIRSPFVATWKNKIKAGTTSDHISSFYDVMPTLAELSGQEKPPTTDGISFLPTLLGKSKQPQHEYLYWEFPQKGGRQAVRMGKWKGVIYNLNKGKKRNFELYNLATDKFETKNVAKNHPQIVTKIKKIMKDQHQDSELFPLFAKAKMKD